MRTDPQVQQALQTALQNYTGEQTEEAVFKNVLVPIAAEYGISATYAEFSDYMKQLEDEDMRMNKDELKLVAGSGKGGGFGGGICKYVGGGIGAAGESGRGIGCIIIGGGFTYGCIIKGSKDGSSCQQ